LNGLRAAVAGAGAGTDEAAAAQDSTARRQGRDGEEPPLERGGRSRQGTGGTGQQDGGGRGHGEHGERAE
jgi:hypothetical protein